MNRRAQLALVVGIVALAIVAVLFLVRPAPPQPPPSPTQSQGGLGVTAIYLNPIFDSASNHGYDTQDYTRIGPYFGTQADWDKLVRQADALGIRIILDGIFNHVLVG